MPPKHTGEDTYTFFIYLIYKSYTVWLFCGNISKNRKNAPAKPWIKQNELYRTYTFECFNCALCTTVLFCRCNATG